MSEGLGAVSQQEPTEQPTEQLREIFFSSLMFPVLLGRLGNIVGHTRNHLQGVGLVLYRVPWCPCHLPRGELARTGMRNR